VEDLRTRHVHVKRPPVAGQPRAPIIDRIRLCALKVRRNTVSRRWNTLKFDCFRSIFLLKAMQFPTRFDVIVVGRRPRRDRGALRARGPVVGPFADPQHRTLGHDVLQPVHRGYWERAPCQGSGRLGPEPWRSLTDEAGIQFRILNSSKAPQSVRTRGTKADRLCTSARFRSRLENQVNLTLFQQAVNDLLLEGDQCCRGGDRARPFAFPAASWC